MKVIGMDIGTTSMSGILMESETGSMVKTISLPQSFLPDTLPSDALQSPREIFCSCKKILDGLITATNDSIQAIAFSSQMHGMLYVDRDNHPLSPYYTWQNQWGLQKNEEGIPQEEALSQLYGLSLYTGYALVTDSLLDRPERAMCLCNIGDFVSAQLAGLSRPVSDVTLASSMGLWDIEKNCFVREDPLFPSVLQKPTQIGTYRGIPLVSAIGDNQASFLGSVKDLDHTLLLNLGTSGQLSFYHHTGEVYRGFEKRPLGDLGFINVAFSLCGGDSYAILASFFNKVLEAFGCEKREGIEQQMDHLDFSHVTQKMKVSPLFLGERGKKESFASFSHINKDNFTPEAMTLGLIEGIVDELWRFYDQLPLSIQQEKSLLLGSGNGIKKNPLMKTIVEKVYGKKLIIQDEGEESARGAAIHALVGIGLYPSYQVALSSLFPASDTRKCD